MISESLLDLSKKKEVAMRGSDASLYEKRINKQHESGKLTARERIDVLLDKGSFQELNLFVKCRSHNFDLDKKEIPCDGVITGCGTIFGRKVFVYSQDFSVSGGSLGEMHAKKIITVQKKALEARCPIIAICESGGARIQEGVNALAGYGEIFQNIVSSSGVIPQISVVLGSCAGGASYAPALTDFIFVSKYTSCMFITGPSVVKKTINEDVSFQELGGAEIHSKKSGVADFVCENDIETLEQVRKLFSLLPMSNTDKTETIDTKDDPCRRCEILNHIVPHDRNQPYDMKIVIKEVLDYGDFYEVKPDFAKNIIVGFGKVFGRTIGIVANQPLELAGCIDINSSRKASRFVRFCDAFNIPVITFIDTPGFLPGVNQESNGIITHGSKLIFAYAEATVPKISFITRKAYGGAYIVMGSKHLNTDLNFSWPSAEIAVLGEQQAGEILFKQYINDETVFKQKIAEYKEKLLNPFYSAEQGYIDDVIEPAKTREYIHRGLEMLKDKAVQNPWKKHGNIEM